jgi:hypothetical protein
MNIPKILALEHPEAKVNRILSTLHEHILNLEMVAEELDVAARYSEMTALREQYTHSIMSLHSKPTLSNATAI